MSKFLDDSGHMTIVLWILNTNQMIDFYYLSHMNILAECSVCSGNQPLVGLVHSKRAPSKISTDKDRSMFSNCSCSLILGVIKKGIYVKIKVKRLFFWSLFDGEEIKRRGNKLYKGNRLSDQGQIRFNTHHRRPSILSSKRTGVWHL